VHLRKKIDFLFVDNLDKALAETLEPGPNGKKAASSRKRAAKRPSSNGASGNNRPSTAARPGKKTSGSRR
jgi:hypothetical protein